MVNPATNSGQICEIVWLPAPQADYFYLLWSATTDVVSFWLPHRLYAIEGNGKMGNGRVRRKGEVDTAVVLGKSNLWAQLSLIW